MGRISPGPTRWPPGAERRLVPAKSNLKPQTHTLHYTPVRTLLCRLPKIIYKQPPATVPPGHCTPHNLVGRAGTHVKNIYFAPKTDCKKPPDGLPCKKTKHSGPLCWATSTRWPAHNSIKQQKPACNVIHKKYSKYFQTCSTKDKHSVSKKKRGNTAGQNKSVVVGRHCLTQCLQKNLLNNVQLTKPFNHTYLDFSQLCPQTCL